MRLICTIQDEKENPYAFAYYLSSQGIDCQCEEMDEGVRVWVYDEDQIERAREIYEEFSQSPEDPRFHKHYEQAMRAAQQQAAAEAAPPPPRVRRRSLLSPAPYGKLSIAIIVIAIGLFVWGLFEKSILIPPKLKGVAEAPVLSKVDRKLLYDYPEYFSLRDQLLTIYTPQDIQEGLPPPPEARVILSEMRRTPFWSGAYDLIVKSFKNGQVTEVGPLFEKIRKGQVWRIFTPALLHFNLLHIFFNLLWFIMLGNQIEFRLGPLRYLILILLTGIVSNTAQYLMSGSFFMGLSGIVCGLAAFIWARQQVAPWEGYLLHRLTLLFLGLFVVGMFALQAVLFVLQLAGITELTIGIANTAHLVGGLVGYLLGRMRRFSVRPAYKS